MPGMRCAVAVCNNNYLAAKKGNVQLSFHKFPKEKDLRSFWIAACKRSDSWNPATSFVCSAHFQEEDFEVDLRGILLNVPTKRKLKKTAVPTIALKKASDSIAPASMKRKERLVKRQNKKMVESLLHHPKDVSEVSMLEEGEVQEDTFEEKYRKLLVETEDLKQKHRQLQEINKSQKHNIDKLNRDLSNALNDVKTEKRKSDSLLTILQSVFTDAQIDILSKKKKKSSLEF